MNDFLKLFFNPNETICISPSKYAYHSISQSDLLFPEVTLESQNEMRDRYIVPTSSMTLCAINPISGDRNDSNVTAFRNFLIEIDDGDVWSQRNYINSLKMPYSICVFSGNKSLHYGICLEESLPDIEVWRIINKWALNIASKADQNTVNPSRSIRVPGAMRLDGKKLEQKLIEIKGRISLDCMLEWLGEYPEKNPALDMRKEEVNFNVGPEIGGIPKWVLDKLINQDVGSGGSRNKEWFGIAMEFAKRGYCEYDIINTLSDYFIPQKDFTKTEFLGIIKSACKRVLGV